MLLITKERQNRGPFVLAFCHRGSFHLTIFLFLPCFTFPSMTVGCSDCFLFASCSVGTGEEGCLLHVWKKEGKDSYMAVIVVVDY